MFIMMMKMMKHYI